MRRKVVTNGWYIEYSRRNIKSENKNAPIDHKHRQGGNITRNNRGLTAASIPRRLADAIDICPIIG